MVLLNNTSTTAAWNEAARSSTGSVVLFLLQLIDLIQDGCLEPAERKIISAFQLGAWKFEARRVTVFGCALNGRPAGIWKPQQPRDLVEGLTRRIIQGGAETLIRQMIGHEIQFGMSAGDEQSHQRELRFGGNAFRLRCRSTKNKCVLPDD